MNGDSHAPGPHRRVWLLWTTAFAAATILGVLETGQLVIRLSANDQPASWANSLWITLPRWLLLAPLAVAVVAVCDRFPLDARSWMGRVPIHAIAAIGFCLAHLTACVVVYGFLIEGVPNQFSFRLQHLLTVYFAMDVLVYASIVGAWSAVRSSQISRERELAATRLRAGLVEAKLDGLRAQLNPHFLFNALNATSTMALRGENMAVVRMLERLGGLLRVSVDPDLPREITLDRELSILDQYLGIQEVRFGDRLTVLREIQPEALQVQVPAMILQPLVENAIQHGVALRPGAGTIRIRAVVTGNRLQLEVHDDGPGWESGGSIVLPQAGDASRTAVENSSQEQTRRGIGLNNTQSRLEYLYGSDFRMELQRSTDGGAAVVVTLPRVRTVADDTSAPDRRHTEGGVRRDVATRRDETVRSPMTNPAGARDGTALPPSEESNVTATSSRSKPPPPGGPRTGP